MATTPVLVRSTEPTVGAPLVATATAGMPAPNVQPLWRFALVGLGPLLALGLFALLVAWLPRLA